MAYSQSDLDSVRRAIIALASGERAVMVSAGGRMIQYAVADMDKLEALEKRIESQLSTRTRRKVWRVITRSGY